MRFSFSSAFNSMIAWKGLICQRWPTTSLLLHLFPQGFSKSILFQRKILLESVLIFLKRYTRGSLPWLLRTTSDILKTKWNKNQRKDVDLGLSPEGFRFIRIRGELGFFVSKWGWHTDRCLGNSETHRGWRTSHTLWHLSGDENKEAILLKFIKIDNDSVVRRPVRKAKELFPSKG